ncbi:MAG: hypothetical protein UT36_C0002G0038 [Candidatus Peregrinibacteria bacterium GW2011_GWF2_39_17]|nr:MAG: hypothetical protein UT36_C0002G0038 [Candidatus Peregrinibacteria bacterium GW2011_GWF2_39_17]HCW32143.1 hypothetical protein [Candidatus Peregrinibacteria bacterium]
MRPLFKYFSKLNLLSTIFFLIGILIWIRPNHPVETVLGQETSAETLNNESPIPSQTTTNQECIIEIADEIAILTADIVQFMEQLYLSEKPASQLAEQANEKFKTYRAQMRQLVTDYSKVKWGEISQEKLNELEACQTFTLKHLEPIEAIMEEHNLRNAGGKTTYTLVKKLKAINEKLGEMNRQLGDIFGAFKTFNDKLPGVVP